MEVTRWRAAMRMQVDDDRSDEEQCGRRGRDSRGQAQTNPNPHPLRYWMQIIVDKSIGIKRYCSQRRSSSFSPEKVLHRKEVVRIFPGKGTTGKGGQCYISQEKGTGEKGC